MLIKSGGFSICVKGQRTGKHIDFAKACVLEQWYNIASQKQGGEILSSYRTRIFASQKQGGYKHE